MSEEYRGADFLTQTAGWGCLPSLAVLRVFGDDRLTWLNGMVSNDLKDLSEHPVYGLILNVKGKILADTSMTDRGEFIEMTLPKERQESLLAHLEKYIIMEDVELEPTDLKVMTLQGPQARAAFEAGDFPIGGHLCARLPESVSASGFDFFLSAAEEPSLGAALATATASVGGGLFDERAWALAHAQMQHGRFGFDFDERTYPQEAGLEKRGISFNKGCYLGQEVICTLQSRGQVSRLLVGVRAKHPLSPGLALRADGKEVGELRSGSIIEGGGEFRGLALVKRRAAEQGATLESDEGELWVSAEAIDPH